MLNGADYNAVDSRGRTSMYIAAEMGHGDAVLVHLNNAYGKTILSLPTRDTGIIPVLCIIIIIIIHEFHRDASLETKLQGRYVSRITLQL